MTVYCESVIFLQADATAFCQEVLEVYSSFRPEVPTFITADRMEQVH